MGRAAEAYSKGMTDTSAPATKQDIAHIFDRLDRMESKFATKDDLKAALANHPTKDDLQRELSAYATKDDLKELATKEDLKAYATKDDLKRELSAYATRDDLKAYATREDVEEIVGNTVGEIVGQAMQSIHVVMDERFNRVETRLGNLETDFKDSQSLLIRIDNRSHDIEPVVRRHTKEIRQLQRQLA